jgi:hypothetical protein
LFFRKLSSYRTKKQNASGNSIRKRKQ